MDFKFKYISLNALEQFAVKFANKIENLFVKKEEGKSLSTNDFTNKEKEKLAGIENEAQKNTVTGVKGSSESTYRTGNINVTKANIGLGNVDNTKDSLKPISTHQQNALDSQYSQLTAYTTEKISDLIGGAPETLDTLGEIATAMEEHEEVVEALNDAIGSKASAAEFRSHETNANIHTTAIEKEKLSSIEDGANKYIHPTSSGSKHIPSGGDSGQILKWASNGTAKWDENDSDTITIDTALSATSTNTVQNKVIYDEFNKLGTEKNPWIITELGTDYNSLIKEGWYRTFDDAVARSMINKPAYNNGGKIHVIKYRKTNDTIIKQTFYSFAHNRIFTRGTNSNWQTVYGWWENYTEGNPQPSVTKLTTPRKINGVEFDGTKDIEFGQLIKIENDSDLNDYTISGRYWFDGSMPSTYNSPVGNRVAFYMDVFSSEKYGRNQIIQVLYAYNNSYEIWIRNNNDIGILEGWNMVQMGPLIIATPFDDGLMSKQDKVKLDMLSTSGEWETKTTLSSIGGWVRRRKTGINSYDVQLYIGNLSPTISIGTKATQGMNISLESKYRFNVIDYNNQFLDFPIYVETKESRLGTPCNLHILKNGDILLTNPNSFPVDVTATSSLIQYSIG